MWFDFFSNFLFLWFCFSFFAFTQFHGWLWNIWLFYVYFSHYRIDAYVLVRKRSLDFARIGLLFFSSADLIQFVAWIKYGYVNNTDFQSICARELNVCVCMCVLYVYQCVEMQKSDIRITSVDLFGFFINVSYCEYDVNETLFGGCEWIDSFLVFHES